MNMANDRLKGRKTLQVSSFLDEFEKDDIKKQVDIVDLFNHFGIELHKKGKSFTGLCPWHKDSNPSLSVDKDKGLYNCFGCGESGDIFTLVEKMKGLDFKESVKFLKEFTSSHSAKSEDAAGEVEKTSVSTFATSPSKLVKEIKEPIAKNKETVKPSSFKGEVEPEKDKKEAVKSHETEGVISSEKISSSGLSDAVSLNTLIDYWHKNLQKNAEAQKYLESRGLNNPGHIMKDGDAVWPGMIELINRFKLGFSDGKLTDKISDKQKQSLIAKGILTEKGTEFFYNSIVVPVFDETGNPVHLYGRSVKASSKVPHKYLKGTHQSVFNRKASKVYDEIIVTESVIDALSLIALGFENVQSLYGTNGFTDEHLQLLKDDRVKTVVIALDNDEPGKKAAEKTKTRLLAENFAVKEIFPCLLSGESAQGKEVKDWNEFLVSGGDKETVTKLIADAETFRAEESEQAKPFHAERDSLGHVLTIGEITYRVTGAKEIFASNLRVNLRATVPVDSEKNAQSQVGKYYDNLDLYSARSRAGYANNMSTALNIEAKRIEKDLITILEYLEEERDRHLRGSTDSHEQEPLTAQEKELGMSLLTDPDMFEQITEDMDILGYVGESLNKQLMYIAATSRKLDDPISVMVISESASGKSYLIDTVAKLMPKDDVISATSLSDQALNYMEDMTGSFVSLGEIVQNETVEHQIREMLSKKELSRLVTMKEPQSGKLVTKMTTIPAKVSLAMSGTKYDLNPENTSRCFVVNTDESAEQTARIQEQQRRKHTVDLHEKKNTVIPEIIAKHQVAQRLLKPIVVNNVLGPYLSFPITLMRTRRDNERFIDLIACVCFMRQYQKERKYRGDVEYINFDLTDYEIAYNIMVNGVLSSSLLDIPRGAIDLYKAFRDIAKKRAEKEGIEAHEISLTQREVRESTGFNQVWIKRHIRILVDFEYIMLSRGGTARSKGHYRLREDVPMEEVNLTMIPTPAELKQKMQGTGYQQH